MPDTFATTTAGIEPGPPAQQGSALSITPLPLGRVLSNYEISKIFSYPKIMSKGFEPLTSCSSAPLLATKPFRKKMAGKKKKTVLEQKIESVGGLELELPKTESKKRTRQDFAPTNFLLLVAADVVAAAKRLRCSCLVQTILVCSWHWLVMRLRCGQLKLGPLQEMVIGHFAGHLNRQRVVETRLVKFAMFINTQKATRFKTKDAKCLVRVQG